MKRLIILAAVFFGLLVGQPQRLVYAHGGDPNLIHSCVNNGSGEIQIVGPNDSCHKNWTPLDWGSADATRTEPRTTVVNCPADSLQDAIRDAKPRDTLLVNGTCNENVTIGEGKRNLTLDGQGAATIDGPNAARPTVEIRARGVTIKGFTIQGGKDGININSGGTALVGGTPSDRNTITGVGRDGIHLSSGAIATINNNTIQNSGRHGNAVVRNSSARIVNSTIKDNTSIGILVNENSDARIGFLTFQDTVARPNTIQNNGEDEIVVTRSSNAVILSNTIDGVNDTGAGVRVIRDSHADIGDNTISNNQDGISLRENSGVNLGDTGIVFDGPNSGNNDRNGIRCRVAGTANGTLGTLTGGTAAKDFGASCTDSLDTPDTF